MKKLFSILTALCLLCAAAAALAEEALSWDDMPLVVTVEEGVELTDADFEGDWVMDKVFLDTVYLTPEQVKENNLAIPPLRIAGGQVINIITDEEGEHEAPGAYTLENNQLLFTDGQGVEAVIEKLEDGNIVLSVFVPRDDDTMSSISYFMVHPEA